MSRKDPYFSFKDRDSVEYKPQYGTAYTPRQEKILSGELPLEDIRPNELSLLKQKAKHLGGVVIVVGIQWMQHLLVTQGRYLVALHIAEVFCLLLQQAQFVGADVLQGQFA